MVPLEQRRPYWEQFVNASANRKRGIARAERRPQRFSPIETTFAIVVRL